MDRKIFSCWFVTHLAILSLLFNDFVSSFPSGYNNGPGPHRYGLVSNLDYRFYDRSCPRLQMIVKSGVWKAFKDDSRIAASILRLHFHDCFVNVSYAIYYFHVHAYVTVDYITHTLLSIKTLAMYIYYTNVFFIYENINMEFSENSKLLTLK